MYFCRNLQDILKMKGLDTRHIRIKDYNYGLPDGRIAKHPLKDRDQCKLLVYNHGDISDTVFNTLPQYLPQGALMVFNNTKVIQARLHFRKETGAKIEIFCLEPAAPTDYALNFACNGRCSWYCLVGNSSKWKEGTLRRDFNVKGRTVEVYALRKAPHGAASFEVEFTWDDADVTFADLLDAIGEIPIPPYLNRRSEESDKTDYQTVYSKINGSVACPTAGLHFTDSVLEALDRHGIDREEVTLHVGAGTFKPVKSEEIEGHEMHSEYIVVHRQTIEKLIAHDGRAVAVGTTSVRTLESLYYIGVKLSSHPDATEEDMHIGQWMPYDHDYTLEVTEALRHILDWLDRNHTEALHTSTQIIIAPGYTYKIVQAMVTNFHQPQSTLLLLVSAFVKGDWRRIYDHALANGYRFLSYGDACLLIP